MNKTNHLLQKNLALAWPLALNVLLVQSMLMIDTLLVAPLGEVPVAAMGIATTIVAFALGIETAIGNGVQLLVGRAHGSRSRADLAVAYWAGLFINVSVSVLFFCALAFYGPNLIGSLTDDAELAGLADSYLSIAQYLILITAYTQVCTAFYNGRGNTRVPLKGYVIEIPANAILSFLLIHGFGEYDGLGVAGAAWGSLAAVCLRAAYFHVVLKLDEKVDLAYPHERPFWAEIRPQFAEIYPIAANFFVLSIGASVYQLLYAQLPLFSFVAITLIFPWVRIGTQIVSAWAQATAINISQALGQGETGYLITFVSVCTRSALALSFLIAALLWLLSQNILLIYPNIEAETQLAFAVIAPLYVLLPIVRGYNAVMGNVLRAIGESHRVLKVHFVTQWVISLPVCALLILYFDVSIFWAFAMMPIEEMLKTIPFYRYTQTYLRRIKRQQLASR